MLAFLLATLLHPCPDEASAKLFAGNCSACHVAPDPSFDTDRAWLHQLGETT